MRRSDSVSINHQLRQERIRRNWRQQDVADKLRTTVVTVNRWERGIQQPSAFFRIQLCALFGKSAEELGLSSESPDGGTFEHDREISRPPQPYSPDAFSTHVVTQSSQNRTYMLERLGSTYSDLMSQSLQGKAWLDLNFTSVPNMVQNATHRLLRMESRAEELLPSGISITEVYAEAKHELLILGEPGTGKSTLLLELSRKLVLLAEQDQTHSLPVILPLSSWAVKRLPLQDWIAEQLAEIYDVPHKLSMQWVQEGNILPLLDGLDEMEQAARPACIAAINAYHRNHLAKLVVCSRTTEYEAASERHRLAPQEAVVVQPLTHEYVDVYLARAGKLLTALRSTLKENAALRDLATIPLMLNILILTYQGTSVPDLSRRNALLLQQVWDDYIRRMVERKGNSKRYPLEQTRAWLCYLARQMRDHNQAVFYLEHLQPNWLLTQEQSTYAWRTIRFLAICVGVLMSILVQSLFFGTIGFSYRSQYRVLGGLLGGLWRRPVSKKEGQGERLWREQLIKRLVISASFGLIYGLSFGLYLGPHYTLDQWKIDGLSYGGVIGLSCFLLQYLLTGPFRPDKFLENNTLQQWKRALRFFRAVDGPSALLVAIIIGLSVGLSYGLRFGPGIGLSDGLSIGLSVGLSSGLTYMLIGLALGVHMGEIHPTEHLSWTWRSLRRSLFNSRHIRITGLLLCISMISVGLSSGLIQGLRAGLSIGFIQGLSYALSNGLSFGLSYWCLLGLFQGIAQERIENRNRRVPNQGIHRSLRNSIILGFIGSGIIGITGILSFGLSNWLRYLLSEGLSSGLSFAFNYGLILGISGGLLIYLLTGGLAVVHHYAIRLLLWYTHTFPWRAIQFLDDATARFLLRRVGGGYSFAHSLLLDHFVDEEARITAFSTGLSHSNNESTDQ